MYANPVSQSSVVFSVPAQTLRVAGLPALIFAALFLGAASAWCQDDPNLGATIKPYATLHGGDIDNISLTSGSLAVDIPIASYPQRGGKLKLNLSLHYENHGFLESQNCQPLPVGCYTVFTWNGAGFHIRDEQGMSACVNFNYYPTSILYYTKSNGYPTYEAQTSDGALHRLGKVGAYWEATDARGLRLDSSTSFVTDAEGIQHQLGGPLPTNNSSCPTTFYAPVPVLVNSLVDQGASNGTAYPRQDTNGNQISNSNGSLVDSIGRVIPAPVSTTDFTGCTGPLTITAAYEWNLPGPSGGTSPVKLCYITYKISIGYSGVPREFNTTITTSMLQSVLLPNGTSWIFQYTPQLGNNPDFSLAYLTQITYPTGATVAYTYGSGGGCVIGNSYPGAPGVVTRTLNPNNGSPASVWTYSYSDSGTSGSSTNPPTVTTTVITPMSEKTVHLATGLGGSCALYETQAQTYSASGTLLKTVTTNYSYEYTYGSYPFPDPPPSFAYNVLPTSVTATWANGQTSQVQMSYDAGFSFAGPNPKDTNVYTAGYGRVIAKREYDYGSGAPGPLLRTTNTSHLAFSNSSYLASNLLNLPSSVQTLNGSGTQVAYTTYGYDESPSPSGVHGNQTSIHKWLNTNGTYLTSTAVYNASGTIASTTDPKLNTTTYGYSSGYAGSGPASVTNAFNQTMDYGYDFHTGLLTSKTDPNGQTTTLSYDSMGRVTSASYPDGGSNTIAHQEATFPFSATLTKKITSSQNYVTTNIFDGLGRLSENQLASDPQGTDYTVTTYDADGREASETNPYRSTSDSTYGVTSYQYDALNRTTLVTKPDGSTVSTSYNGNCTTVTDEAGKNRQSCTDGLGRLTQLTENPGGLGYVTNYQYDALNNLTSVLQNSSRQRTFVYDSLSRLTSSTNPETGTISYAYDADGNVITKTDARGITTTNSYDALNRITQKSYSDGTMSAFFAYDGTGWWGVTQTNTVGRLMEAWTGTSCCANGGAEIFSYDPMGRILLNTQYTPAMSYLPVSYTYDLAGDMLTETDTDGVSITFSYQYNSAQRATAVTSSLVDATHPATLASGIQYAPNGAMSQITYGNGLTESSVYNSRLQPCRSNVNSSGTVFTGLSACGSTSMPTGNVLDLQYSWNAGSADNGNLVGTTVAGAQTYSRAYTYDQLNRLSSMSGSGGLCTGLNWSYDAWGNRTSQTQLSGTCFQQPTTTITASNQLSGYGYDAAGNMTSQPGATYTYDAESQLTSASGGSASYVYDASGRRVQKTVSGAWKGYLYNLQGNVVSEEVSASACGGSPTGTCPAADYVYLNGRMIVEYEYDTTYFVTGDHLGSSRLLTTLAGGVQDCNGFYPYGEQDAGICASSNTTTHKFTGKERDAETGNDDFGARYYSSSLGRFMSADWSSIPEPVPYANLTNPQTLNLYAIVSDNPESFADLDGHESCDPEGAGPTQVGSADCQIVGQNNTQAQNNNSSQQQSQKEEHGKLWKFFHAIGLVHTAEESAAIRRQEALRFFKLMRVTVTDENGNPVDLSTLSTQQLEALQTRYWDSHCAMPMCDSGMLGYGGTRVTSHTLWESEGAHIDVENPNPGQRPGQIHYQDASGKYIYDLETKSFRGASNAVNKLLDKPDVQRAIQTGLRYLGVSQ